jgi:radical SAM protein with 4Fe4S-binding SPASM domain
MIHKENLKEFKDIKRLAKRIGIKEWGIDYPVFTGNLKKNNSILPSFEDAIKCLKYRFGASYHSTDEKNEYACGSHLMTLTTDGKFLPCGFFNNRIFGRIEEGLMNAVANRRFFKLKNIKECQSCAYLQECRGGCRFRARGIDKRDLIMCKVFGC